MILVFVLIFYKSVTNNLPNLDFGFIEIVHETAQTEFRPNYPRRWRASCGALIKAISFTNVDNGSWKSCSNAFSLAR